MVAARRRRGHDRRRARVYLNAVNFQLPCSVTLVGRNSIAPSRYESAHYNEQLSLIRMFFMALAAGTRLGPYEIVSPLGAGGMGGPPLRGGSQKFEGKRQKS